jgi:pimeloyl-ACP methyl ester carboxylesterase
LAREVFLAFVLGAVPEAGDRARLASAISEPVLAGQRPDRDPGLRESFATEAARAVHDLLTARSQAEARAAIASLPADTLAFIDAISPERRLAALRSPVWLMHERDDHHVPFVESRHLESALEPGGLLERHTEFRLFDHVQPDDLDPLAAAPELWKLLWHLHALLTDTL